MPTTLWKQQFVVNPTVGNQSAPTSVGLRNGNILVMWQDDNNTSGPGPNNDIVGQMFDPEGNPIGGPFQVNSAYASSGETEPKVVALPNGGYVVAYGTSLDGLGGFIAIERYNAAGQSVFSDVILDNNQGILSNWRLTADPAGNYTIAFARGDASEDESQIKAIRWDYGDNARGFEHRAAENGTDYNNFLGDVAVFANGDIITIGRDDDFGLPYDDRAAQFQIINPVTGDFVVGPTEIANDSFFSFDVAVLAGGQFVLLYAQSGDADSLVFRVGASGAPGAALSDARTVVPEYINDAQIVALRDGGFIVVWSDQTQDRIFGARFDAGGARVGANLLIASGTYGTNFNTSALGSVSLTGDGRVLVSYRSDVGEIALVIIDPRDLVIQGTADADIITTRLEKGVLYGLDGADVLLGQGGDDELYGGLGADILDGGDGDDDLYGGADGDTLRGAGGNDAYILDTLHTVQNGGFFFQVYDVVQENAGSGVDTVRVRRLDGFGAPTAYTLTENVEAGVVEGALAFDLNGNVLGNHLTGNGAANRLEGRSGADILAGGLGADTLVGGEGDDDYILDNVHTVLTGGGIPRNHYDAVVEAAGEGVDRVLVRQLRGENGVLTTGYTLNANIEIGIVEGTADFSLIGNDIANTLTGNAAVNALDGLGGNDVLDGGGGADRLAGGLNNDAYVVDNAGDRIVELRNEGLDRVESSVSYNALVMGGNIETIILTGAARAATGDGYANTLIGNASNNVLNGYKGADRMEGKAGTDVYYVDNIGDVVVELAGQGTDQVISALDYVLGANLENLTLGGSADTDATGNSLVNRLAGNTGDNVLNGLGGADYLTGGLGADTFVFSSVADSSLAAYDRIRDLNDVDDTIDLQAVDANANLGGNQDFVLVEAFTHVAGQMTLIYNATGNFTQLLGDVTGDGRADFRIFITGNHEDFDGFLGVS